MREDIQGGLRNAMERGASLEQAIKSFLSAGYAESEVREAAKIFATPTLGVVNSAETTAFFNNAQKQVQPLPAKPPVQTPVTIQKQVQPIQQMQQGQVHGTLTSGEPGTNKMIIILVVILIILVGVFIASLIFKDQIASALKTALGK